MASSCQIGLAPSILSGNSAERVDHDDIEWDTLRDESKPEFLLDGGEDGWGGRYFDYGLIIVRRSGILQREIVLAGLIDHRHIAGDAERTGYLRHRHLLCAHSNEFVPVPHDVVRDDAGLVGRQIGKPAGVGAAL